MSVARAFPSCTSLLRTMPVDSLRWPRTHQHASASRRGLSPDHNLGACRARAAQGLPLTLTPQNRARRALRHVPNYNDSGLAFNRARLEAGTNVGAIHAHQSEAARAPSTRAHAAPRRTAPRRAAPRRTAAAPAPPLPTAAHFAAQGGSSTTSAAPAPTKASGPACLAS